MTRRLVVSLLLLLAVSRLEATVRVRVRAGARSRSTPAHNSGSKWILRGPRIGAASSAGGYSDYDRQRLFRWQPRTFTRYSDEPQDQDRLGGALPTWLEEAAAENREMEALRQVRALSRTIVLGQGTSVLAREFGPAVDRFHHVVRFNRFEVEGYERWVGNRTTVWVLNNIDIKLGSNLPGMKLLHDMKHVRVVAPSLRATRKIKDATKGLHDNIGITAFDFKQQEHWKAALKFTSKYFSTGIVALIHLREEAPIAIHGFDFAKGSHGHYFARLTGDACHDVAAEGFIFQQLQRDGVIVPLACLESEDLEELRRECAITRIVPPANPYAKKCKKDDAGVRTDIANPETGDVAVHGKAGLPPPMEISKPLVPQQN
eukprot:jgi/Tetstr1/426835/TSEL_017050.t1